MLALPTSLHSITTSASEPGAGERGRSTLMIAGFLLASTSLSQTIAATDAQDAGQGAAKAGVSADDASIRPFRMSVSEDALVDLHRRLAATRWPEKEQVSDASQGVQLSTMKKLVSYWQTDYNWHRQGGAEAKLSAMPQFVTTIDGLDIHFIHVRSKYANALPVIVTHGWPGSVIEQLKIIDPLVNPTNHGGAAEDAFDVVIPALPGYGFSGKPSPPVGRNRPRRY